MFKQMTEQLSEHGRHSDICPYDILCCHTHKIHVLSILTRLIENIAQN